MNIKKLVRSFYYAARGLFNFIHQERNIKVQLFLGILALLISLILQISFLHWLIIIGLVFFIPGLEMLNGIVEEIADLLELPYTKSTFLRDLSAGLVLWFSLMALILGIMVFSLYI